MWYGNLAFSSSALPFPARLVGLTGIDDPYKFLLLVLLEDQYPRILRMSSGVSGCAVASGRWRWRRLRRVLLLLKVLGRGELVEAHPLQARALLTIGGGGWRWSTARQRA
uniref:Uncharacterized protein n=1 Tax=Oryza rufipogon TaxID=4529 RepID=A0A0E0RJV3_ORYRU